MKHLKERKWYKEKKKWENGTHQHQCVSRGVLQYDGGLPEFHQEGALPGQHPVTGTHAREDAIHGGKPGDHLFSFCNMFFLFGNIFFYLVIIFSIW